MTGDAIRFVLLDLCREFDPQVILGNVRILLLCLGARCLFGFGYLLVMPLMMIVKQRARAFAAVSIVEVVVIAVCSTYVALH